MSRKKQLKIVAIGLYRPGTGFTRVLTTLFSHLKESFDIHWLGISHRGEILDFGYKVYPSNLKGGDMYGAFEGYALAETVDADIVLLLNDFWMFKNYNVTFLRKPGPWKIFAYIPLDGAIKTFESMGDLSVLDHAVMYTQFAADEVNRAFAGQDADLKTSVIPHGTETNVFYPLFEKDDHTSLLNLKQSIFSSIQITEASFIVLNANRYSERKDLETTLNGFGAFAKNKEDILLCLHQPGIEPHFKDTLLEQADRLGIRDKMVINPFGDGNYVDDAQLNALYNVCDVGLNTSLGEGWGMISFEHAACRKPQIIPAHTACKELWENHALMLEPAEAVRLRTNPFEMYRSSPTQVAELLHTLYHSRGVYDSFAQRAFENANRPEFQWESVAKEWSQLLQSL